jgi:hypothetical protein
MEALRNGGRHGGASGHGDVHQNSRILEHPPQAVSHVLAELFQKRPAPIVAITPIDYDIRDVDYLLACGKSTWRRRFRL